MARQQVYRGNPEVKQSILFDNFSGGINTTDIDDQVLTNQFRHLKNVELSEMGRIKNRKGFANLVVFNELLTENLIEISGDYYLFNLVIDEYNTFNKLKEYNSLESFKEAYTQFNINIVFILAKRVLNNVLFYKLGITHVKSSETFSASQTLLTTYEPNEDVTAYFRPYKLTGNNVESYDGKYYMLLNEINSKLEGIIEYYWDDDLVLNIRTKSNSYVPNAYEVSNIGFNLFSNSPLTYVKEDTQGIDEIRSIFLTDIDNDNRPLTNIPLSGVFKLNILYKGDYEDLTSLLNVSFYAEDSFGEKIPIKSTSTLSNTNENLGVIQYDVTLNTVEYSDVFIRVSKSSEVDTIQYTQEFSTTTEMVNFYKTLGSSRVLIDPISTSFSSYHIPNGTTMYGYKFEDLTYSGEGLWGDTISITGNSEQLLLVMDNIVATNVPDYSGYNFAIRRVGSEYSLIVAWINADGSMYSSEYITIKSLGSEVIDDIDTYVPNSLHTIKVSANSHYELVNNSTDYDYDITAIHSRTFADQLDFDTVVQTYGYVSETYAGKVFRGTYTDNSAVYFYGTVTLNDQALPVFYVYNEGLEGTINDFDGVSLYEEFAAITHTQMYSIEDSNDKEVKSIDMSNARHIIIKDRMFIYSGNTIIVSDTYSELDEKSFSYFPNYNYITISLESDDSIQKIAYFRGSYLVFTKNRIYRMSGDFLSEDFIIVMINDALGCSAPDSVRSMNNTLVFMTKDGLYTVKQNFYQDGLENVDKIDRQVYGLIPRGTKHESMLYNEQYLLFVMDEDSGEYVKTVKQYYNMQFASKSYPYVTDTYVTAPNKLFKISTDVIAINNGELWIYDVGYTDFAPTDATEDEIEDYTYKFTIISPYWSLGYPLHEKKFKNLYVKVDSKVLTSMYFSIYVDNLVYSTSYDYLATMNEFGEIEYVEILDSAQQHTPDPEEYTIAVGSVPVGTVNDAELTLGEFNLGYDPLGGQKYKVHKVQIGAKGKTLAVQIEQKQNSHFAVDSIGLVYKLGKLRENR